MQPNVCLYTTDLFVCLVAYSNFFFSLSFSFFKSQEFMFWHKMEVFCLIGCFLLFLFLSNAAVSLTLNFECLKVCLGNGSFSSLLSAARWGLPALPWRGSRAVLGLSCHLFSPGHRSIIPCQCSPQTYSF